MIMFMLLGNMLLTKNKNCYDYPLKRAKKKRQQ